MRDLVIPRVYDDKEAEILVVGCGNSELSSRLYEEGYHYITNGDFSSVCIEEMRDRCAHLEEMDFVEMDITEPQDILDSDSFTCIIDKGTLDCVACSSDNTAAMQVGGISKRVKQMLDNLHRILAPGGCYICVSHGRPETRLPLIASSAANNYKWTVETIKVPKRPATAGLASGAGIDVLERID